MSDTGHSVIETKDLTVRVGGCPLLESVTLNIGRGEHVAIVGPNGAGKTTLLRSIMGLLPVHSGSVRFGDEDLSTLTRKELALRIGYVPQQLPDGIEFTVSEFIGMGRYAHHGPFNGHASEDKDITAEVIALTGLEAFAERRLNTLSGGERQRASIAAALAQRCPILILDEPCTHLDPRQEADVQALVARIGREQELTILTVTHDLNWAAVNFDRILGLSEGRLVADATPAEFMKPESLYELYGACFQTVPHPDTATPVIVPSRPTDEFPSQSTQDRKGGAPS